MALGVGPDQIFLLVFRHPMVREDHRLAAAVGQARRGVLERHGARQPEAFLQADVRRHAQAADRWARGDVVDDDDPLQAGRGFIDVENLRRPQAIGETKDVIHGGGSLSLCSCPALTLRAGDRL